MQVRKAVITAGARGGRLYPAADTVQKAMLPFIDRDGLNKPVLQIIAEEALESGIEEICVVCAPGDEERYREGLRAQRANLLNACQGAEWAGLQEARLENLVRRLSFAVQEEPLGYGHAVLSARAFTGDEPFLLLLGDHLYISHQPGRRCAHQLLELAARENAPVSAVHATREHLIGRYGTVSGRRLSSSTGVWQLERIREKPSVSLAELELQVPGLRAGFYLCFFGMHVLPPSIFQILERKVGEAPLSEGSLQLTPALQELAERERYLALEVEGSRHDIGTRYGLMLTQLALAASGRDREEVLTSLTGLLAETARRAPLDERRSPGA